MTLTRATRRDLRRAMGDEAIGVIDQHDQVLKGQALALSGALRDLHDLMERHTAALKRIATLEDAVGSLQMRQYGHSNNTAEQWRLLGKWRHRVRWVLTGRLPVLGLDI